MAYKFGMKVFALLSDFPLKTFQLKFQLPFEDQRFRIDRPAHLDVGESLSFTCKLPDASSKVLNDSNSKVRNDASLKVRNDASSKVLNDANSKVPNDASSKVPNDANSKVPNDANSIVPNDASLKVLNDASSKVRNDAISTLRNAANSQCIFEMPNGKILTAQRRKGEVTNLSFI